MTKKIIESIQIPSPKKTLETVKLSDLTPYPGNPRHNTQSAKMVAKSIEKFGYINPIVVDENNVILAGNTRFKALKLLKVEEAEVLRVSGLTDTQRAGFVIADNRAGEYSKWNATALDRMVANSDVCKDTMKEFGISSIDENKKALEALING